MKAHMYLFILASIAMLAGIPSLAGVSTPEQMIQPCDAAAQRSRLFKAANGTPRQAQSTDSLNLTVLGDGSHFVLHWSVPPELSCLEFTVERVWSPGYTLASDAQWIELDVVPGFCDIFETVPYSYVDRSREAIDNGSMQYRLRVRKTGGEIFYSYSEIIPLSTPERFEITGMYPQPATHAVTVSLLLAAPAPVQIQLSDSAGRLLTTLPQQLLQAGQQSVSIDVSGLPTGFYFCEMRTADAVTMQTLRVIR